MESDLNVRLTRDMEGGQLELIHRLNSTKVQNYTINIIQTLNVRH